MADLTLLQLTYFVAAVEHGSLSAAATAQHLSQPGLSEQIRRLENTLGVTLFVRTNRRLVLTDAGHELLPAAQNALLAARAAAESVRPVRTLTGGSVSFGTFSSAHHLLLREVIEQFRRRYPDVRMRIVGLNSTEVADAVRAGTLEAGLVALPVDDQGLRVWPVVWTGEVVYFSADPQRVRSPMGIEQVLAGPLILPEARWGNADPTRRTLLERAQRAGLALRPQVEVESSELALALTEAGAGDTVISLVLAQRLGYADRLPWNRLDPPLDETYTFITRQAGRLSPATRVLMDLARPALQGLGRPPDGHHGRGGRDNAC